jgi:hypothetical protein
MEGGNISGNQKQPLADASGTVVLDLFGDEHTALPGDYRVTVRTNQQVLTAAFSISTAGLKPGDVIVSDQFDNNALGWDLSSSPIGVAEVVDGQLKLTVKWKQQSITTLAPFHVSDFDLSVDVKHEKGPIDSFASIWFGPNYTFDMFVNGSIVVNRLVGGEFTNLLAISPESSFKPYDVNRVRIIARGNDLEFYRNDVLIGSLSQQEIEASPIWLGAFTLSEGGLIVSFDNLTLRVPVEVPAKTARRWQEVCPDKYLIIYLIIATLIELRGITFAKEKNEYRISMLSAAGCINRPVGRLWHTRPAANTRRSSDGTADLDARTAHGDSNSNQYTDPAVGYAWTDSHTASDEYTGSHSNATADQYAGSHGDGHP